jgi:hypothetical protein
VILGEEISIADIVPEENDSYRHLMTRSSFTEEAEGWHIIVSTTNHIEKSYQFQVITDRWITYIVGI